MRGIEIFICNHWVKIWWSPFKRGSAWQFLRLGGHTQFDYYFIDFFLWRIRVERKKLPPVVDDSEPIIFWEKQTGEYTDEGKYTVGCDPYKIEEDENK